MKKRIVPLPTSSASALRIKQPYLLACSTMSSIVEMLPEHMTIQSSSHVIYIRGNHSVYPDEWLPVFQDIRTVIPLREIVKRQIQLINMPNMCLARIVRRGDYPRTPLMLRYISDHEELLHPNMKLMLTKMLQAHSWHWTDAQRAMILELTDDQ